MVRIKSKFKRRANKGFTLIELVVVIAVIAILGGVAVAAYFGVTNSAKESADQQAVAQMNTLLLTQEISNPNSNINEMFQYLEDNGLDAEDYKPLYENRYFYWDKNENQIVYTDENKTVLFPENKKDYTFDATKDLWYSLTGEITESKPDIIEEESDKLTVTVSTAEELYYVSKNYSGKTDNKTVNIKIDQDINLMGANISFGEIKSSNFVFDGGGHTLSGIFTNTFVLDKSEHDDGNVKQYFSGIIANAYDSNVTFKNLTIKDSTIGKSDFSTGSVGILMGKYSPTDYGSSVGKTMTLTIENVDIENCDVYGKNKVGAYVGQVCASSLDKLTVDIKGSTIKNVNIYSSEGEAAKLFGVVYGSKNESETNINVTGVDNITKENVNVELVPGSYRDVMKVSNELKGKVLTSKKPTGELITLDMKNNLDLIVELNDDLTTKDKVEFDSSVDESIKNKDCFNYRRTVCENYWLGNQAKTYFVENESGPNFAFVMWEPM